MSVIEQRGRWGRGGREQGDLGELNLESTLKTNVGCSYWEVGECLFQARFGRGG